VAWRTGDDRVRCTVGAARAPLAARARTIKHLRSAHDDHELEALRAARQRLAGGQGELEPGQGFVAVAAAGSGRNTAPDC
jgi:hypothetical protein